MADLADFKSGQIVGACMAGANDTKTRWIICWLVGWSYDISTLAGYLTPNPFLCN